MEPSPNFRTILADVTRVLSAHVEFAFLVGSAATPRQTEHSDVDLAVYWKDPNFEFHRSIQNELVGCFNREVDLVTLNTVDVIFGMQVVSSGRLLIDNNSGLLLDWKSRQLSQYPDFKMTRSVIEENILRRKKYV